MFTVHLIYCLCSNSPLFELLSEVNRRTFTSSTIGNPVLSSSESSRAPFQGTDLGRWTDLNLTWKWNFENSCHLFSVNPDFKEVLKQLSRQRKILDEQGLKLEEIYQKLNEVVNISNQKRDKNDDEESVDDVAKDFPIGTQEALQNVERRLQTATVFKKLVCICWTCIKITKSYLKFVASLFSSSSFLLMCIKYEW